MALQLLVLFLCVLFATGLELPEQQDGCDGCDEKCFGNPACLNACAKAGCLSTAHRFENALQIAREGKGVKKRSSWVWCCSICTGKTARSCFLSRACSLNCLTCNENC